MLEFTSCRVLSRIPAGVFSCTQYSIVIATISSEYPRWLSVKRYKNETICWVSLWFNYFKVVCIEAIKFFLSRISIAKFSNAKVLILNRVDRVIWRFTSKKIKNSNIKIAQCTNSWWTLGETGKTFSVSRSNFNVKMPDWRTKPMDIPENSGRLTLMMIACQVPNWICLFFFSWNFKVILNKDWTTVCAVR